MSEKYMAGDVFRQQRERDLHVARDAVVEAAKVEQSAFGPSLLTHENGTAYLNARVVLHAAVAALRAIEQEKLNDR